MRCYYLNLITVITSAPLVKLFFWAPPNYKAGLVASCRLSRHSRLKVQQRMEAHFLIQPNIVHPFVLLYSGGSSGLIRSCVIKCGNLTCGRKKYFICLSSCWNRISRGLRCVDRKTKVLHQWSRNPKPGTSSLFTAGIHFWNFPLSDFKCTALNK